MARSASWLQRRAARPRAAAPALARRPVATALVYGASLGATALALLLAAGALLTRASLGATMTLPVGLPWLGAHFRLDALSAFFLVVINLGGAAASLFALGMDATKRRRAACCCSSPRSSPG